MNRICAFFVYAGIAVALSGCGAATINPNYTSAKPDLMRIGGGMPDAKGPEILNLGSYCLQVTEKWNADGKTPDDQVIWTKDSIRRVVPCQ
ncbi:hypothetical protein FCL47_01810 [Desulfopila sp. IMCC35006]|uniref:hypothetical protein n=1 Tax=Desulfopila sp. IMCC35006 TaxID=2569542 RepID=UPI0010AB8C37|nr:hypothetical protein [Desulfopila sp. IMCC35006]TKB28255.1 hypothetical protein FCL47_01810 [Desulfopila sp. IMCC35006]